MSRLIIICSVFILISQGYYSVLAQDQNWSFQNQIEKYKGQKTLIRQTVSLSPIHYARVGNSDYSYEHYFGPFFPARMNIAITLDKFKISNDCIQVYFKDENGRKGRINFYAPQGKSFSLESFNKLLKSAFIFENEPLKPLFIGNSDSKIYHAFGSNHLPDASKCTYYADAAEAEKAGMSPCKVCFYKTPLVSDFYVEEFMGRQSAANIRSSYPTVMDDEKQGKIRASGNRVLSNWPLPLVGYDYSFTLVEAPDPNAIACPAGHIFVTSGLLDIVENDDELDAVIAHEVAHVEKRHGLRQLKSLQKAQTVATIAALGGAILGGALGGKNNRDSGAWTGYEITTIIANIAAQIALAGYSRSHEEEADAFANMYFIGQGRPDGRKSLQILLDKLRFSSDVRRIGNDVNALSSHPNIVSRAERAKNSLLSVFTPPPEFEGIDSEGEILIKIRLESQMFDNIGAIPGQQSAKTSLTIFATAESTPYLEKKMEFKDINIKSENRKLRLDNKEDTELYPSGNIGMVFISDDSKGLIEGDITEVSIPSLTNIKSWKKIK